MRISGQDVGRATFAHRHVMLVDQETNEMHIPFNSMEGGAGGRIEVCNRYPPPIPFTVLKTSCKCTLVIQSTLGFATMGKAQNSFYSRPLKITGTSVSSQKENKERWGIILNHFLSTNHPMLAANQRKKEVWL